MLYYRTYYLVETNVPDGYNKCDDITITIGAEHEENTGGATAALSLTGSENMDNTIINKKGSELPSTGGMGTKLFIAGGSSFPVGGANTHAVISGHRGLPSAKLFTDLDKIVEGDIFTVNILNEVFTYEVERILVILPDETDKLSIFPDEDIVTLMTCTPYGINSHRLLIRAHRIDTVYDKKIKVSADAMQVDTMKVFVAVLIPLLLILFLYWHISAKYRKNIRIDKYIINKLPKERRDDNEI